MRRRNWGAAKGMRRCYWGAAKGMRKYYWDELKDGRYYKDGKTAGSKSRGLEYRCSP
jgi:hypothetical protein